MGVQIPQRQGVILGERVAHCKVYGLSAVSCAETSEAVWVVDSVGLKEAQVQSYLPGGANVPSHVGTLAPPGKYD